MKKYENTKYLAIFFTIFFPFFKKKIGNSVFKLLLNNTVYRDFAKSVN